MLEDERYIPKKGEKVVYSDTCLGPYKWQRDIGTKMHIRFGVPDPNLPNIRELIYCNGLSGKVCENCSPEHFRTHRQDKLKRCLYHREGMGIRERVNEMLSELYRRFRERLSSM